MTLSRGVPDLYDLAIDGKGYLLATEMQTPFAPLRSSEAFLKVGRDLKIERQDNSEDMSENKVDGLFWSSQRSAYSGSGQKRLDSPEFSDDEAYLRSKNVDVFRERGAYRLSRAFETEVSGVNGGSQTNAYVTNTASHLIWVTPKSATPSAVELKILTAFGGATTARGFAAPWLASDTVSGMCNDGQFVYAASASNGVWRGTIADTADLSQWKTRGQRDIAFVKSRILGHTTDGGSPAKTRIYETDTGTGTENLLKEYSAGWAFPSDNPLHVFAEIKGFAAWVITNGNDGTLWLWDGVDSPFQAARFPGLEAQGVYAYAESVLYILAKESGGAFDSDHWVIIECELSSSGDAGWDVLHRVEGPFTPVLTSGEREILFPVQVVPTDYSGLTADNGVLPSDNAPTVAALNLVNKALSPAKHWGLYADDPLALSSPLWGATGFAHPNITFWKKATILVGENGEVRVTKGQYATTGELLSSAIDKNLDHDKVFLLGELATEPLPADASAVLQYQTTDPDTETPVTYTIGSIAANGKLLHKRIAPSGVKAPFLHYRVQLASDGTSTPVVRKAGVGCVYGRKPTYETYLTLLAMPTMSLRNGTPWPADRTADDVALELEKLRDAQTVVDYQEPTGGLDPRDPVKVQVREVEKHLLHVPNAGWGSVVKVKLEAVPD